MKTRIAGRVRPMQRQRASYIYRKSVDSGPVDIATCDFFRQPILCLSLNIENGKLPVPERYFVNQRNIKPMLFVRRKPEVTIHESVELMVPMKMED